MCNIERRSEYNLITLNMVTQKQLIIVSSTFLTKSKPWRNHLCFFCISNVVTLSLFHSKANAHGTYIYRVCKKVVVRGIRILPTYSIFSRCFHDLGQNLQQRNVKEFSGPMDIHKFVLAWPNGGFGRMLREVGSVWKEVERKGIKYNLMRLKHPKANRTMIFSWSSCLLLIA